MKKFTLLLLVLCMGSVSAIIDTDCISGEEAKELLIETLDNDTFSELKYSEMVEMINYFGLLISRNMQGDLTDQKYNASFAKSGVVYGVEISCTGEVSEYTHTLDSWL